MHKLAFCLYGQVFAFVRDQTDWNTQTANLHEGLFSQGFGVMGRLKKCTYIITSTMR